jgi:DNA-binding LacI/PurR family transcriptional regulator
MSERVTIEQLAEYAGVMPKTVMSNLNRFAKLSKDLEEGKVKL